MNLSEALTSAAKLRGFVSTFSFSPAGISCLFKQKNQIMDSSIVCLSKLLGLGDSRYKVGAIYFEYQNLADPGDMPTPPTFTKDEGLEYFTGLQYSSDRDFVRVPVIIDPNFVTNTSGSLLVSAYAVTPSTSVGFFGKAFTSAANSAVYGGALVATPVPTQQTQDVVIARNYPTSAKVPVVDGEQICTVWTLEIQKPE